MTISAFGLAGLLSAGIWAALSRRLPALLTLTVASVVWPFVNGGLEGPVLWVLAPGHGLTLSDLLTPLGVAGAVAGMLIRRSKPTPVSSVPG